MSEDPIIEMLKRNNIADHQIVFLMKVLNKVRSERKKPDWEGAESTVRVVLEQEVKSLS